MYKKSSLKNEKHPFVKIKFGIFKKKKALNPKIQYLD